jgi:hypothetical protein
LALAVVVVVHLVLRLEQPEAVVAVADQAQWLNGCAHYYFCQTLYIYLSGKVARVAQLDRLVVLVVDHTSRYNQQPRAQTETFISQAVPLMRVAAALERGRRLEQLAQLAQCQPPEQEFWRMLALGLQSLVQRVQREGLKLAPLAATFPR